MTEPICDRCLTTEADPRGDYSLDLVGRELHYLPEDVEIKPPVGEKVRLCGDCFRSFIEMTIEWWENVERKGE